MAMARVKGMVIRTRREVSSPNDLYRMISEINQPITKQWGGGAGREGKNNDHISLVPLGLPVIRTKLLPYKCSEFLHTSDIRTVP